MHDQTSGPDLRAADRGGDGVAVAGGAPEVDAVVVHYPSVVDLRRCVAGLVGARGRVAGVTVVDNGAADPVPDDVRDLSGVAVVERTTNAGFAVAANEGAARGRAPLILFVNPDVRFEPADLAELAHGLDSGDAGPRRRESPEPGAGRRPGPEPSSGRPRLAPGRLVAVGPRLSMPDGRPQVGDAGFFPSFGSVVVQALPWLAVLPGRWARRPVFLPEDELGDGLRGEKVDVSRGAAGHEAVREVDWVSGAFLLVRRRAFEAVGGFDERFFMYGDDMDLCLRFHRRGWRVGHCPGVEVVHDHDPDGGEGGSRPSARARWLDGLDRYYRLHRPRTRRLLHGIAALGFGLRALAYGSGLVRPRSEPRGAGRRLAGYARRSLSLALAR